MMKTWPRQWIRFHRNGQYKRYTGLFKDIKGIKTPTVKENNTCVYAQFTSVVENRDELQAKLKEKGIPTAVHYPIPLNKQPIFEKMSHVGEIPNAEYVAEHVISLLMRAWLKDEDMGYIMTAVRELI